MSRKGFPKQFVDLVGERTLFQVSAQRLTGPGFARPVILTGSDFRFIVSEQLKKVEIAPAAILIEPEARNTGPAVLAAALHAMQSDPDCVLLVAPSDHVIADTAGFRAAVSAGLGAVRQGRIVTFGIAPDRPETGYGYLELSPEAAAPEAAVPLLRFIEKPDHDSAVRMLDQGNFLWNAGIFLFAARDIVSAFERHAPEMSVAVRRSVERLRPDLDFLRLDPEAWAGAEALSVDYAVMERADNLSVVPYAGAWSDLGGWDAVAREMGPDGSGNARSGPVTAIDCRDTLLRSEADALELVGIGLDGLIVVAMPDAVLVADKNRAQDVKLAVTALKQKGAKQAEALPTDYRPWGWFETLALGERFQVKRIVVNPGAALSLQSHFHRAEHWIVVQGTARVTVDKEVRMLTENQSIYVPLGAVHRLENPGKVRMVMIEVQSGAYLGEDDIVRYEDVYARGQGEKG